MKIRRKDESARRAEARINTSLYECKNCHKFFRYGEIYVIELESTDGVCFDCAVKLQK